MRPYARTHINEKIKIADVTPIHTQYRNSRLIKKAIMWENDQLLLNKVIPINKHI